MFSWQYLGAILMFVILMFANFLGVNLKLPVNLTGMSLDCESQITQREPVQT